MSSIIRPDKELEVARRQRKLERADRERRRREELAAAIARPLISADLLSDEDRAEIYHRVRCKERSIGVPKMVSDEED